MEDSSCRALLRCFVFLSLAWTVAPAAFLSKMQALGDRSVMGNYGPQGRSGASAVVTDDSRLLIFGGRSATPNGDFLNDLWLYDWNTGNWTAYQPNELICDQCMTCSSVLANRPQGSQYILSDNGSYLECSNENDTTWQAASQHTRALGASCAYHTTCMEWTGLRPFANPKQEVGANRVNRELPSGRYHHGGALVLNLETGERDTLVIMGGFSVDCTDYCNDTWHYNLPRNTWTEIRSFQRPAPARRWKHAFVDYKDAVYMFGGQGQRKSPLGLGEQLLPNEIYDTQEVYDGTNPLYFDDLWLYNATEREWERLYPNCTTCIPDGLLPDGTPVRDKVGPRGRFGASMVISGSDADGWSLFLFGGYAFGGASSFLSIYPAPDYTLTFRNAVTNRFKFYPSLTFKYYMNDLWKYDLAFNTWTQIFPNTKYPKVPSPRFGCEPPGLLSPSAALCMAPHLGPLQDSSHLDPYWSLNWSHTPPPTVPPPVPRAHANRHVAAVSISGSDAVMIVYGGYTWNDEIGDMWQYNISSNVWIKVVDPAGSVIPSRRYDPIMVPVGQNTYDTTGTSQQSGRMLISGGHGCLSGENYIEATNPLYAVKHTQDALGQYSGWDAQFSLNPSGNISVHGNYFDPVTGQLVKSANPDLWIEQKGAYGEKYCMVQLDDLWQYYPSNCPNDCTRHGVCLYNSCVCNDGHTGFDCSNVTCPLPVGVTSSCYYDYVAHQQVCNECSGAGVCNGLTGTCECTPPASGVSCSEYSCLNDCSNNGNCIHTQKILTGPNAGYGVCNCTLGRNGLPAYTGDDCSIANCPTNPSLLPGGANLAGFALTCSGNGACVQGACSCFAGFGDSFLFAAWVPDASNQASYLRIPVGPPTAVDAFGAPATLQNALGVCGWDAIALRYTRSLLIPAQCAGNTTPVPDCGEVLFQFGGAVRRAAAAAALLWAALAALVVLET